MQRVNSVLPSNKKYFLHRTVFFGTKYEQRELIKIRTEQSANFVFNQCRNNIEQHFLADLL